MEWTDKKVFQLIKLYESESCLYDVSCKEYHNRNKKKQALDIFYEPFSSILTVVSLSLIQLQQHKCHRRTPSSQCCSFVAGTCYRLNVNANRYRQSSLIFR